ncbi:DUF2752 domain-containing protein [Pedobacter frigidisoli]|uniref:DUF2752 domain-containing protein n=1 Tax=Pedobacter frigidisoli TaxID=2530455 RepID=A0A4R0NU87_9SPHI|nr:DUF2752 domain-containing protein [Pedobacter frigidisoli]TCD04623.1 DUF2752 domain-containing protein [Pedobacter frigidisoli]
MDRQLHNFLDWLGHHLFACPFKTHFGFDCPGCGFQRSVLSLLKGDLLESFKLYPATIPLLFIFIYTIVHLRMDLKIGAQVIKIAFAGVAVIILINYIYKIYNHQLIS